MRRATQEELEKNKRWEISALWEVEYRIVDKWLEEQAALNYGRLRDIRLAEDAGEALPHQIVALFEDKDVARDARIIRDVNLGVQKKDAPNSALIAATGILKWIALLSEVGLFLFMAVMGFGSYVLIILGVLLALSGYALGSGIGHLIINVEEGKGLGSAKGWMYLTLGVLGTAGISYVRAAGLDTERVPAVIVPIIVALTIALFEAMHMALHFRLDKLLKEVFQAQRWFSSDRFVDGYKDGLWKQIYTGNIAQFAKHEASLKPPTEAGSPTPEPGPKRVAG